MKNCTVKYIMYFSVVLYSATFKLLINQENRMSMYQMKNKSRIEFKYGGDSSVTKIH